MASSQSNAVPIDRQDFPAPASADSQPGFVNLARPVPSTSSSLSISLPRPQYAPYPIGTMTTVSLSPTSSLKRKRKAVARPVVKPGQEAVRKSSRRHSGLFGNPDRPTYREPTSDEDDGVLELQDEVKLEASKDEAQDDSGNESDGDPPFLTGVAGGPLVHGPVDTLPSSPVKLVEPVVDASRIIASPSASTTPAPVTQDPIELLKRELGDSNKSASASPALTEASPSKSTDVATALEGPKEVKSNDAAWETLEDIVYASPKSFTSLVFQIASDLGMVVVITDDRTTKTQSAYMHITCAYRRAGCPFILKLAKAREGGWVMRSQNPSPHEDSKLARSNYKCIHPAKTTLADLPPSLGPAKAPLTSSAVPRSDLVGVMPPKKKQKMIKARPSASNTASSTSSKRPSNTSRGVHQPTVTSSMDIDAQGLDDFGNGSRNMQTVKAGRMTGSGNASAGSGAMATKRVDSRVCAPPFQRSLLLEKSVAPALSSLTSPVPASASFSVPRGSTLQHHINGNSRTLQRQGSQQFSLDQAHIVYRPVIVPQPTAPRVTVLPRRSSLADWQTFLTALEPDLAPLAHVLASPSMAVSPQSFFAEKEELRLALVESLEPDQVGTWPRLRLKTKIKERGQQVWDDLVEQKKVERQVDEDVVPIQPDGKNRTPSSSPDKCSGSTSQPRATGTSTAPTRPADSRLRPRPSMSQGQGAPMEGIESESSARPTPELGDNDEEEEDEDDDDDDDGVKPAENQYTARLQALYSGSNSVQTAAPTAPDASSSEPPSPVPATDLAAATVLSFRDEDNSEQKGAVDKVNSKSTTVGSSMITAGRDDSSSDESGESSPELVAASLISSEVINGASNADSVAVKPAVKKGITFKFANTGDKGTTLDESRQQEPRLMMTGRQRSVTTDDALVSTHKPAIEVPLRLS
ncbi:hypothetical protein OIO90_000002 [Microbotryomycetes sp. JL221]|nr:hypothetical protein OIO90_000002 [Microbotryomycetes sp. JL221]